VGAPFRSWPFFTISYSPRGMGEMFMWGLWKCTVGQSTPDTVQYCAAHGVWNEPGPQTFLSSTRLENFNWAWWGPPLNLSGQYFCEVRLVSGCPQLCPSWFQEVPASWPPVRLIVLNFPYFPILSWKNNGE